MLPHLPVRTRHGVSVGDVADDAERVRAALRPQRMGRRFGTIDHGDAAAFGQQRLHDRAAHCAGRTGEQRHRVL